MLQAVIGLTPQLTEYKHLVFDAPGNVIKYRIHTCLQNSKRAWDGAGHYSDCSYNSV